MKTLSSFQSPESVFMIQEHKILVLCSLSLKELSKLFKHYAPPKYRSMIQRSQKAVLTAILNKSSSDSSSLPVEEKATNHTISGQPQYCGNLYILCFSWEKDLTLYWFTMQRHLEDNVDYILAALVAKLPLACRKWDAKRKGSGSLPDLYNSPIILNQ